MGDNSSDVCSDFDWGHGINKLRENYTAPWLAASIFGLYAWDLALTALIRRKKFLRPYEYILNFWTPMYIGLCIMFCMAVKGMYLEVLLPTSWLDPDVTRQFAADVVDHDQMACNDTTDDQEAFKSWEDEAEIQGTNRWASIFSPVWTLANLIICFIHMTTHVSKIHINNERLLDLETSNSDEEGEREILCEANEHHRSVVWIGALPIVYGLMSMKSAFRLQQAAMNHVGATHTIKLFQNFGQRLYFLKQVEESNNYVGDLYETWGLVAFARILLRMIHRASFSHKDYEHANKTATEEVQEPLFKSLSEVSMVGIKAFYYVCLIQACWYLFACQMAYVHGLVYYYGIDPAQPGIFVKTSTYNKIYYMDYGCGLVASCVAIYDLIALEHHFLHLYERVKFAQVNAKFWATKILVSLAFLQSIVKSFLPLTEVRSSLLFASVLTLECMLIALFHRFAWSADEDWFRDFPRPSLGRDTMKEPLLQ